MTKFVVKHVCEYWSLKDSCICGYRHYQCIWTPSHLWKEADIDWLTLKQDCTSFAKYPLRSSNPSFGALKYLNRTIMQYMCNWHLAHTGKNMVLKLLLEYFLNKNFSCVLISYQGLRFTNFFNTEIFLIYGTDALCTILISCFGVLIFINIIWKKCFPKSSHACIHTYVHWMDLTWFISVYVYLLISHWRHTSKKFIGW